MYQPMAHNYKIILASGIVSNGGVILKDHLEGIIQGATYKVVTGLGVAWLLHKKFPPLTYNKELELNAFEASEQIQGLLDNTACEKADKISKKILEEYIEIAEILQHYANSVLSVAMSYQEPGRLSCSGIPSHLLADVTCKDGKVFCNQLLNIVKQQNKKAVVFVKSLSAVLQYLSRAQANFNDAKTAVNVVMMNGEATDDAINSLAAGLCWLRKAFHTEVQLSILGMYGVGYTPRQQTCIYSNFEPCRSCEKLAGVQYWVKNDSQVKFICANRDSDHHNVEECKFALAFAADLPPLPGVLGAARNIYVCTEDY
jgi:hypothetical protein